MVSDFLFVAILGGIAFSVPILGLLMNWMIRPKRFDDLEIRRDTYECGLETIGETWVQFRVQYYIYAIIFVVFDVETVFLYPWAVAYNKLGLFALVEMLIFLLILFVGLIYAWREGALEWI